MVYLRSWDGKCVCGCVDVCVCVCVCVCVARGSCHLSGSLPRNECNVSPSVRRTTHGAWLYQNRDYTQAGRAQVQVEAGGVSSDGSSDQRDGSFAWPCVCVCARAGVCSNGL